MSWSRPRRRARQRRRWSWGGGSTASSSSWGRPGWGGPSCSTSESKLAWNCLPKKGTSIVKKVPNRDSIGSHICCLLCIYVKCQGSRLTAISFHLPRSPLFFPRSSCLEGSILAALTPLRSFFLKKGCFFWQDCFFSWALEQGKIFRHVVTWRKCCGGIFYLNLKLFKIRCPLLQNLKIVCCWTTGVNKERISNGILTAFNSPLLTQILQQLRFPLWSFNLPVTEIQSLSLMLLSRRSHPNHAGQLFSGGTILFRNLGFGNWLKQLQSWSWI